MGWLYATRQSAYGGMPNGFRMPERAAEGEDYSETLAREGGFNFDHYYHEVDRKTGKVLIDPKHRKTRPAPAPYRQTD